MSIETKIAGFTLVNPLINAAGTCKTAEDFRDLVRSPVVAITIGSITREPRSGNSRNAYKSFPVYSINSLGLPNPGLAYCEKNLPQMVQIAHDTGKVLIVSIVGSSLGEYAWMSARLFELGVDIVEQNWGYSNVWSGGVQKSILSHDYQEACEVLYKTSCEVDDGACIAVKISPVDPFTLVKITEVIEAYPFVKVVVGSNTIPNVSIYDQRGSLVITDDADGYGDLAGPALKPVAIGLVRQLRALLPDMDIIFTGGIMNGGDVRDAQRAGANAVGIATHLVNRGPRVFSEILTELV